MIQQCMGKHPHDRPTAGQAAETLLTEHRKLAKTASKLLHSMSAPHNKVPLAGGFSWPAQSCHRQLKGIHENAQAYLHKYGVDREALALAAAYCLIPMSDDGKPLDGKEGDGAVQWQAFLKAACENDDRVFTVALNSVVLSSSEDDSDDEIQREPSTARGTHRVRLIKTNLAQYLKQLATGTRHDFTTDNVAVHTISADCDVPAELKDKLAGQAGLFATEDIAADSVIGLMAGRLTSEDEHMRCACSGLYDEKERFCMRLRPTEDLEDRDTDLPDLGMIDSYPYFGNSIMVINCASGSTSPAETQNCGQLVLGP